MSDLPPDRVERTAPFSRSGVDVFGPYTVHDGRNTRRTRATKKVWVVIFTCLYSRAIHLELVSSLDSASFQMALRRFTAVRGSCSFFRSDRGSNFVGAWNEASKPLEVGDLVTDALKNEYTWCFLPPGASHFAGVWERKIGSIKRILDAAVSLLKTGGLSREELHTLLLEAANIVNWTPLADVSSDPNDPYPVSPAQLITQRESPQTVKLSSITKEDLEAYGRKRWRRIHALSEHFWTRWKRDYLRGLQVRRKWKFPKRNVSVGDVVLVRQKTSRNEWPLGLVIARKLSSDGLVRSVTIRLKPLPQRPVRNVERCIGDVIVIVPSDDST